MKEKDAYYFPHDSNAQGDPKCALLIDKMGPEGYGIYWMLIETLRDQPRYKYPIILISSLARKFNTTPEKLHEVINEYKLFEMDEENFFSHSLIRRMEPLEKRKEDARQAGIKSAQKRLFNSGAKPAEPKGNEEQTTVQPTFNDSSTIRKDQIRSDQIRGEREEKDDPPQPPPIVKINGQEINQTGAAIQLFERDVYGRPLNQLESEMILEIVDEHGFEIVKEATKTAIALGSRNIKYIQRILGGWRQQGLKSLLEIQEYEAKRDQRKLQANANKEGSTADADQKEIDKKKRRDKYENYYL